MPDSERKKKVCSIRDLASRVIHVDPNVIRRAKEIAAIGIKDFDAVHIACAEFGKVDIFLTTDDEIIKNFNKNTGAFKVVIRNPLAWLAEVV